MVYTGWLQFAGTELVNNSRAAAYSANMGGPHITCTCRSLAASLGDVPYTNPAGNDATHEEPAPWFDKSVPESKTFAGFVGLEFTGANAGTAERQWTELLADGGVPGALRRGSRELGVKVLAVAADTASLSYGVSWLASALRGSACPVGCSGDELCAYTHCPTPPVTGGDPCTPGGGTPDPTWTPITGGDAALRMMFDAALIEGPEVTSTTTLAHGVFAEVEYTIKVGNPYWWHTPATVISGGPSGGHDVITDQVLDYDPWFDDSRCATAGNCLDGDPENTFCPDPPPPPVRPPVPADPCFPNDPRNYSKPNGHLFHAGRMIFRVRPGAQPDWFEQVPVIHVESGGKPLKRLTFRWYDNPQDRACGTDLNPCLACTEITVPFVPRNTTLTIDGRIRRALIQCPGTTAEPTLYGRNGGFFTWPTFDCTTALCCEVVCDLRSLAADAHVTIQMASREDVI